MRIYDMEMKDWNQAAPGQFAREARAAIAACLPGKELAVSERCETQVRTHQSIMRCSLQKGHDGICSFVFDLPDKSFTQRDLDLAVLEARWNEHVTSCSACIRIESGHIHWRCDRRADLQKRKAQLPKT
jgi:hypothetical protein